MKRLIYMACAVLFALAYVPALSAQENLLTNPGFEEWSGETLQGDWKHSNNIVLSKETGIKKNGDYSLKVETAEGSLTEVGMFVQSISGTFQQGDVYELTINYYLVKGNSWLNIVLNSNWENNPNLDPMEALYWSDKGTLNAWKSHTMEVNVPNEGASEFNFIIQIDPGTTLILDDFSFKKKEGVRAPFLTVTPEEFPLVETTVGAPVEIGKAIISYGNLPRPLNEESGTLYIGGSNRDQFKMKITEESEGKIELTLTYAPTKATVYSNHTARVQIDSEVEGLGVKSISLTGKAYAEEKSIINIDRAEVTFPETTAGQIRRDTVRISSMNMREEIKAVVKGDSEFTISTNFILVNADNQVLGIEYRPKKAGTHTATITLTSDGAETKTIIVTGIATGDLTNPDKQGDEYPLDASNPITLLNETFDNVPHNQPFAIEGWKNIAAQNYRAWWGYDFNNVLVPDAIKADEQVAKATLYNSLNPTAVPYEMWLYTPALDFKNAGSKIFTFRVSASKISDEVRKDSIELYYVEPDVTEENGLYCNPVKMYMPSTAEDNDEWFSYHLDLGAEGNNVADVFFMAFRVSGTGGNAGSTSYYIDDVSFGRSDLPKINIEQTQIAFESQLDATAMTPDFAVTAENLTEPIKLTVGGSHKSKFKVTPEILPEEGGSFKVEFSSDQQGEHFAYVKLSSRSAADVYLDMLVNNKATSSINEVSTNTQVWVEDGQIIISSDQVAHVKVFSVTGHEMASYTLSAGTSILPGTFNIGVYIVKVVDELQATSYKLQVK